MPTIRERNGRHQAQVRIKRGGVIVYEVTETFDTHKLAYLWGCGIEDQYKAGKLAGTPSLMTCHEAKQGLSALGIGQA
jgi:hypothetical protein